MPRVGDGAHQRRGDGQLEVALHLHAAQDQLAVVFVLAADHVHHAQGVRHADGAGEDLADVVEPTGLMTACMTAVKPSGWALSAAGVEFLHEPLGEHLLGADAGAALTQRCLVGIDAVDDIGEVFLDADGCRFDICTGGCCALCANGHGPSPLRHGRAHGAPHAGETELIGFAMGWRRVVQVGASTPGAGVSQATARAAVQVGASAPSGDASRLLDDR